METKQDLPIILFASPQAWEEWLAEHHATSKGVWIKYAKKGSGVESVKYAEAVEVALCYGWIDGQAASLDESYSLQRFTPRGPRSNWSKINRARVEKLIEEGRMRPAGLTAVEKAKSDGRWERAYDSPRTATVPDDLQRAFDQNPEAAAYFATLDSTNRYAVLYRIQDAKRPETRARRIAQFVEMLSRHEKVYP
jgi:uncharacterized protein YdeI (YjbR/CyaY-like superfamily)